MTVEADFSSSHISRRGVSQANTDSGITSDMEMMGKGLKLYSNGHANNKTVPYIYIYIYIYIYTLPIIITCPQMAKWGGVEVPIRWYYRFQETMSYGSEPVITQSAKV
jgi:hypothetical protein